MKIMTQVIIKAKRNSFKKIEDPMGLGTNKYLFYANVSDVPEHIPMATNPREQKLTSGVAQAIEDSLKSNDGFFHLKNRGIVLSAKKVQYDVKRSLVTIDFEDDLLHGNIDGGHTYKIICEHKQDKLEQIVQFEVMTGVEDIIEALARARNTSVQVDEKSLAELANKFDPIKDCIKSLPFLNRIAFKQNQIEVDDNNKKLKMIDTREIVAILSIFNIHLFDEQTHPIKAYSSKAVLLKQYLEDDTPESYRRFSDIAVDIFELYETIETEFPNAYNNAGGRYGRKKYSGYKGEGEVVAKSKFWQKPLNYKVPDGIMYPLLAAFRALVIYNAKTDRYEWYNGKRPKDLWDDVKESLSQSIMNFSNSIGDNPNTIGKDNNIWNLIYLIVKMEKK